MKQYLREDLQDLKPYKPNDIPYKIKMDANEYPIDMPESIRRLLAEEIIEGGAFNLYPDSDANELRGKIASLWGVDPMETLVGTGSDELIQVIINALVEKEQAVLTPSPSFSMYKIFTQIAGGKAIEVPLDKDDFEYDFDAFYKAINEHNPKVIFLCTPNNPTGNIISSDDIFKLTDSFDGVVVVDEAYGEFYGESMAKEIVKRPNAILLKTFSKALAMAGLRTGYLICNKNLASQLHRVKPPYNINTFSQRAAVMVLEKMDIFKERVEGIIGERERVMGILSKIKSIRVFPSRANFFLVRVPDSGKVFEGLASEGILVRNFGNDPVLKNCLRISVGTEKENDIFLNVFSKIIDSMEV